MIRQNDTLQADFALKTRKARSKPWSLGHLLRTVNYCHLVSVILLSPLNVPLFQPGSPTTFSHFWKWTLSQHVVFLTRRLADQLSH